MIMVIHEAVGVAQPVIPLDDLRQQVQKGPAVRVIGVDGSLGISTAGQMIEGTGKSDTLGATHDDRIADSN
jgi:hypothetical protein